MAKTFVLAEESGRREIARLVGLTYNALSEVFEARGALDPRPSPDARLAAAASLVAGALTNGPK